MFKKLNWGHGVAIALGIFMLFILSLLFFFTRGWQNAELVSNNYYEEELHYQNVIDDKKNAEQLSLKPIYSQNHLGIHLQFPNELEVKKNEIKFHLFRTDDANLDIHKTEILDQAKRLNIPSKVLVPGSYTLKLQWSDEQKNYQIDYNILWK